MLMQTAEMTARNSSTSCRNMFLNELSLRSHFLSSYLDLSVFQQLSHGSVSVSSCCQPGQLGLSSGQLHTFTCDTRHALLQLLAVSLHGGLYPTIPCFVVQLDGSRHGADFIQQVRQLWCQPITGFSVSAAAQDGCVHLLRTDATLLCFLRRRRERLHHQIVIFKVNITNILTINQWWK